ncbi:methyl-accepting chemotaxis protein [Azospirillum fermentarium]|uniref:methyl-accepting chemotaxis protein n=1 Tax=Azospirillum fermentarium TaxID=1233114 RepID=UPI0022279A90|nr:methyl-accepting chemotaxis protein [Azospirillum fermentarium]MCW2245214.1 methyl-accepting chemotaxis protein [Azospirillum fermentarium]
MQGAATHATAGRATVGHALMGDADRAALARVAPLLTASLDRLVDDFYGFIRRTPALWNHIGDEARLPQLKAGQRRHWENLLNGQVSADYEGHARRVGETHARIGLPPHAYIVAYMFMLARLIETAEAAGGGLFGGKRGGAAAALTRLVMADMELTLSAYETAHDQSNRMGQLSRDMNENLHSFVQFAVHSNEAMVTLAELSRDSRIVKDEGQAVAAAASELVASVDVIARNSQSASDDARAAGEAVERGRRAAADAVSTMRTIAGAVEATVDKIDNLAAASDRIGEILVSIDAISKQTNLLALNATIEAARAGEAGKGFAVVAGEVKALANQTARATEDIRGRIDTLRAEMAAIVTAMRENGQAVAHGQDVIAATGNEMEQVAAQVGSVTDRMHEIAEILNQQSSASGQISHGINTIADKAAHNDTRIGTVIQSVDRSNAALAERVEQFAALKTPRALCEVAKVDHVVFKKRIVDALMERVRLGPDEVANQHTCRLGKWYDNLTDERIRAHPAYRQLAEPHARVHDHGKNALRLKADGRDADALAELQKLNAASHEVLTLLERLSSDMVE